MRGKFPVPFYHPLPKSLHVVLQFVLRTKGEVGETEWVPPPTHPPFPQGMDFPSSISSKGRLLKLHTKALSEPDSWLCPQGVGSNSVISLLILLDIVIYRRGI